MKYIGEKCAACQKEFTADDDVVVCPECGSPHHRECYSSLSKCANESFHAEKKKWRPAVTIDPSLSQSNEIVICPECRFPNIKGDKKCIKCGVELPAEDSGTNSESENDSLEGYMQNEMEAEHSFLGFNQNEDMGGATLKEVSQFVCTNTIYYIPIFKHMKDFGSKLSFNLPCLIFPYFYFANRKMWGWAMLSAIISVILRLPTYIIWLGDNTASNESNEAFLSLIYDHQSYLETLDNYFGLIGWIVSIIFCLFGNWLYYKHTMKHLKRMKIQNAGDTIPADQIMSAGGVKPVNILIIAAIMGGILVALLFGSMQLYNATDFLKSI